MGGKRQTLLKKETQKQEIKQGMNKETKPKENTKTNCNKQKLAVMGGKRQTPVRKGNIKTCLPKFQLQPSRKMILHRLFVINR